MECGLGFAGHRRKHVVLDKQVSWFIYLICFLVSCFQPGSRAVSPVTITASAAQVAVHQLPSVIGKPKIFMAGPGQMLVNGPSGTPVTNGTHLEIKRENGEGE